jgi:hypothetical protein
MSEKDLIRKALKREFQTKQDRVESRPGQLGDGYGNLNVPGMESRHVVYCRVAGAIEEVICRRIPPENDLLVTVGFAPEEPNQYQVLSVRTSLPGGTNGGAISGPSPASRYEYLAEGGGQDPLFVQKRAYLPLRIGPYSGMLIQVYRDIVWTGTAWAAVNTQTLDLTPHIPATTGKAAFVLITLDDSAAIIATKGSEVDIADLGLDDLPAVPAGTREVLGAVRVYYGQIAVQEARTNTDIVDLRDSGWGVVADHGSLSGLTDADHPASAITVDATGFAGNLSSADSTVQAALATIDALDITPGLINPTTTQGDMLYLGASATNYATSANGSSVLAVSTTYSSYYGSNIIDENDGTYWTSLNPVTNQWFVIDLGSTRSIGSMRLMQQNSTHGARSYVIATSDDGSAWTDRHTRTVASFIQDETFDFSETLTARYFRVTALISTTGPDSGWGVYTCELISAQADLFRLPLGAEKQVLKSIASFPDWTSLLPVYIDDVSSPPTDAELDSAIGAPASVGAGFGALLDDNNAGTAVYLIASDGTNWWYTAMTKAT